MTAKLPTVDKERKDIPIATGCLDYFPDALAAVAALSKIGNDKHNPGEPLHWARGKSNDHPDCLIRHFMERGTVDTSGVRHSTQMAWRALAILQLELEEATVAVTYPYEPAKAKKQRTKDRRSYLVRRLKSPEMRDPTRRYGASDRRVKNKFYPNEPAKTGLQTMTATEIQQHFAEKRVRTSDRRVLDSHFLYDCPMRRVVSGERRISELPKVGGSRSE